MCGSTSMHMHNSILSLKICVHFVEFMYTYKQGIYDLWQNVLLQYKWLNYHEKFISPWYNDKTTGVLLRIRVMGQDRSMKHEKNKVDTFFSEDGLAIRYTSLNLIQTTSCPYDTIFLIISSESTFIFEFGPWVNIFTLFFMWPYRRSLTKAHL